MNYIEQMGAKAQSVARGFALAPPELKNSTIHLLTDLLLKRSAEIIEANALDISAGRDSGLSDALIDRLTLDHSRLEGIVENLRKMDLQEKTVAILRSSIANTYLRQELEKIGANVLEFPAYESAPPSDDSKVLIFLNDLFEEKIDAITFTSSSTVQNLFKIADEHAPSKKFRDCLEKTVVVAIGPTTQRSLEELGVKVDVVPNEYTIEAMIEALARYMHSKP